MTKPTTTFSLINAVALPKLGIFTVNGGVDPLPLQMILTLSKSFSELVLATLPEKYEKISKHQLSGIIQTEKEQIAVMSQKLKEMDKKLQEKDEKLREKDEMLQASEARALALEEQLNNRPGE